MKKKELKAGEKAETIYGDRGNIVRVLRNEHDEVIGADIEIKGEVDRFYIDEIKSDE